MTRASRRRKSSEADLSVFDSDAVFGVKSSLIVDLKEIHDDEKAKALGFKSAPYYLLERDVSFILLHHLESERADRAFTDAVEAHHRRGGRGRKEEVAGGLLRYHPG